MEKRGIAIHELVWWIVAALVLVIGFGLYLILKNTGFDALEFIKRMRFW